MAMTAGAGIALIRSSNSSTMARNHRLQGLDNQPPARTRLASSGLYGSILPTVKSTGVLMVAMFERTFSHTSRPL